MTLNIEKLEALAKAATPGPWLRDGSFVYALQDGKFGGKPIRENRFSASVQGGRGCTFDEAEANAALIVQAVNSYEPMLYALRYIQQMADPSHSDPDIVKNVFKVATDAITIAEGRK